MKNQNTMNLTREKHLDHLVKVIPFIFFCYGIQCFTLFKIGQTTITGTTLLCLGLGLATLASLFTLYDLRHKVDLDDTCLTIKFLWYTKNIPFNEMRSIEVDESDETFCKLKIATHHSKYTFYFLDNGVQAKEWIEARSTSEKNNQDFASAA